MSDMLVYILLFCALIFPVVGSLLLRIVSQYLSDKQIAAIAIGMFGIALASVTTLVRSDISSLSFGNLTLLLPLTGSTSGTPPRIVALPTHTMVDTDGSDTNDSEPSGAVPTTAVLTESDVLSDTLDDLPASAEPDTTQTADTLSSEEVTTTATAVETLTATVIPTERVTATQEVSPTTPTEPVTATQDVPPTVPTEPVTATQEVSPPVLPTVTPTEVPTEVPTATPPPELVVPAEAPADETQVYTIQPGDTIGGIAAQFGIEVDALLQANGMTEDDAGRIQPGQELVIPAPSGTEPETPPEPASEPRVYVVQQGDTIRSIAEQFGIDVSALLNANAMSAADADAIYPGQELVIP